MSTLNMNNEAARIIVDAFNGRTDAVDAIQRALASMSRRARKPEPERSTMLEYTTTPLPDAARDPITMARAHMQWAQKYIDDANRDAENRAEDERIKELIRSHSASPFPTDQTPVREVPLPDVTEANTKTKIMKAFARHKVLDVPLSNMDDPKSVAGYPTPRSWPSVKEQDAASDLNAVEADMRFVKEHQRMHEVMDHMYAKNPGLKEFLDGEDEKSEPWGDKLNWVMSPKHIGYASLMWLESEDAKNYGVIFSGRFIYVPVRPTGERPLSMPISLHKAIFYVEARSVLDWIKFDEEHPVLQHAVENDGLYLFDEEK